MITNHGRGRVLHPNVLPNTTQLSRNRRLRTCASFFRGFFNKLLLFIGLESVLVALVLFGTGYVAILN